MNRYLADSLEPNSNKANDHSIFNGIYITKNVNIIDYNNNHLTQLLIMGPISILNDLIFI